MKTVAGVRVMIVIIHQDIIDLIKALPFQTAWALLSLLAVGEADTETVKRGINYLIANQSSDGHWYDDSYTAPGFPRVFYLKYHGYTKYFPFGLWLATATLQLSLEQTRHHCSLACRGKVSL